MPEQNNDSPERRVVVVVQRVLAERAVHHAIGVEDDLREAGMTSLDMIGLVLLLEAEFGLMIPETSIMPANFRSVARRSPASWPRSWKSADGACWTVTPSGCSTCLRQAARPVRAALPAPN